MSAEMSHIARVRDTAFHKDPAAIHALMTNRVPCNQALADDKFIVVESNAPRGYGGWTVSALGLINGVLSAAGLPEDRQVHSLRGREAVAARGLL